MAGKEAAEKDGAAEAKGGGKLKLIIMVLPLVLLLAGAGWYFFLKPKADTGPVTLPEPVPGAVIDVDPITVNLAGGHFLQIGLGLQPVAGLKEAPSGSKALDLAIDQFSGKSMDELASTTGREKNKEQLIARVKLAYLPEGAEKEMAKEAGTATKAAEKSSSDEGDSADTTPVEGDEKLTPEQAVKKAGELTVQPEIYDVYFTEFVMK